MFKIRVIWGFRSVGMGSLGEMPLDVLEITIFCLTESQCTTLCVSVAGVAKKKVAVFVLNNRKTRTFAWRI